MKKALLSILSILLLNLLIISEAQCAFTRDDLDTFRASALTGDVSLEVLGNLRSRPPSYFRANPPTQWLAQNTDEEVSLEPYLAILNQHLTSEEGGISVLTFNIGGLSTSADGQYIFSSLSQLLSSLVGYTGSSSVPASIEALPAVQSLLSTINTYFITQQTEDGLFPTFGLQVTNPSQQSLATISSLVSFASGFTNQEVPEVVNIYPYVGYMNRYMQNIYVPWGDIPSVALSLRYNAWAENGPYPLYRFTTLSGFLSAIVFQNLATSGIMPSVDPNADLDSDVASFLSRAKLDLEILYNAFGGNLTAFPPSYYSVIFNKVTWDSTGYFPSFSVIRQAYRGWLVYTYGHYYVVVNSNTRNT